MRSNKSDTNSAPSSTAKKICTAKKSSAPESQTDCLTTHPSGLMCQLSPQAGLEAMLELLSSDSLASLSPTRGNALARRMNDICSEMLFESLLMLEPPLSSAKTYPDCLHLQPSQATSLERTWVSRQISLFALPQSQTYTESWPKAGIMRDGQIWGQRILAHRTDGIAGGVSLGASPTPRYNENIQDELTIRRVAESESGSGWPAGVEEGRGATLSTAVEANLRNQWQTPSSGNFRTRGGDRADELGLDNQVRQPWATPVESPTGGTAEAFLDRKRMASRPDLEGQKGEAWPTPQRSDDNVDRRNNMDEYSLRNEDSGKQYSSLPIAVRGKHWNTPLKSDDTSRGFKDDGRQGEPIHHQVLRPENWATPQEHDKATGNAERVGRFGTDAGGRNLTDEVVHPANWSTPKTTAGDYTRDGATGGDRLTLSGEAAKWTTPQVIGEPWATPIDSDYKGSVSLEAAERRALESPRGVRLPEQVSLVERKLERLNPAWEELLMSWPCGWTDITQPCAGVFPGFPAGQGSFQYDYEPPRTIHRDRCRNRTKRVSAIGNGVVTICSAEAFYLLLTEPIR